jgi:hypothetical protein
MVITDPLALHCLLVEQVQCDILLLFCKERFSLANSVGIIEELEIDLLIRLLLFFGCGL